MRRMAWEFVGQLIFVALIILVTLCWPAILFADHPRRRTEK